MYAYALSEYAAGNPFFLWGTCQGFQLLCACAADDLNVIEPGFEGVLSTMLPLDFDEEQRPSSVMFGDATTPSHIIASARSAPSTLNVHRYGVTPATFASNAGLKAAFRAISTNVDSNGRRFVSTMEHRTANIFGLQWHSEWPPFDFTNVNIVQSGDSIAVSSYVAQFIRSRLMLCRNRFNTVRQMESMVIERSPVSYAGFGWELFWARPSKCVAEGQPRRPQPVQNSLGDVAPASK